MPLQFRVGGMFRSALYVHLAPGAGCQRQLNRGGKRHNYFFCSVKLRLNAKCEIKNSKCCSLRALLRRLECPAADYGGSQAGLQKAGDHRPKSIPSKTIQDSKDRKFNPNYTFHNFIQIQRAVAITESPEPASRLSAPQRLKEPSSRNCGPPATPFENANSNWNLNCFAEVFFRN